MARKGKKGKKEGDAQIIINFESGEECRVALIENGRLEAFDVEIEGHLQTRGNIYKGILENIEPSLGAAFIDIGLNRNAYLPLDEIHPEYHGYAGSRREILANLKRGQEFLVQIVKEETSLKGSAVTPYLSIPGRYLVLMPGSNHIGVSRKIEDEEERERLKQILKGCKIPDGIGLIARTASHGVPKAELQKDLRYLVRLWENIKKRVRSSKAPCLIFKDRDLVTRFLRDHLTAEVGEIVVDDKSAYDTIRSFLKIIAPRQVARVQLYEGPESIFHHFGLEPQISQIYQPRVELPSGGYIIVEPTEALVSIDVNSGRNIKEKDIEETALSTNMEAAAEIARQLRLRDLGGIIVVDFIDMKNPKNNRKLERHMKECLKKDRARTEIGRISKFGLLEVVRQKIRSPLQLSSHHTCPCCNGRGMVQSVESLALSHLRRLRSIMAARGREGAELILTLPIEVTQHILNRKRHELCRLEEEFSMPVTIQADSGMGPEEYQMEIKAKGNGTQGRITPRT